MVDSYTIVNLSAGYDFTGFNGSDMRLDIAVNNVFDEAYFIEYGANGIVGRPREAIITLTSRF